MLPQTSAEHAAQAAAVAAGVALSPMLVNVALALWVFAIGFASFALAGVLSNRRRIDLLERQAARLEHEFEARDRLFAGEFEKRREQDARTERAFENLNQQMRNQTDLLHVVVKGHMGDTK